MVFRLDTRHRPALAFGIINVMWLEANYAFGRRKAEETHERFASARAAEKQRRNGK